MLNQSQLDTLLRTRMPTIYSSSHTVKAKNGEQGIDILIKGPAFGKANILYYKNAQGIGCLIDGGYIMNQLLQVPNDTEDFITSTNNNLNTHFISYGSAIKWVCPREQDLASGLAAFYVVLDSICHYTRAQRDKARA